MTSREEMNKLVSQNVSVVKETMFQITAHLLYVCTKYKTVHQTSTLPLYPYYKSLQLCFSIRHKVKHISLVNIKWNFMKRSHFPSLSLDEYSYMRVNMCASYGDWFTLNKLQKPHNKPAGHS